MEITNNKSFLLEEIEKNRGVIELKVIVTEQFNLKDEREKKRIKSILEDNFNDLLIYRESEEHTEAIMNWSFKEN